jgi:hypothetical protein
VRMPAPTSMPATSVAPVKSSAMTPRITSDPCRPWAAPGRRGLRST